MTYVKEFIRFDLLDSANSLKQVQNHLVIPPCCVSSLAVLILLNIAIGYKLQKLGWSDSIMWCLMNFKHYFIVDIAFN